MYGHDQCIRLLLDAAADPNLCSSGNRTPLMAAVRGGHPTTVALLLAAGADKTIKNDFGEVAADLVQDGTVGGIPFGAFLKV